LGVLIVLPFTRNFAHLIEKLVPSNDRYLYELDYSLPKKEPKLALLSLQQAIQKTFLASLLYINEQLNETEDKTVELRVLQKSMDELQEYMEKISLIKEGEKEWEQLMALLHGMNHLDRLIDRCEELRDESITLLHSEELLHGTLLLTKQNSTIIELFAQNNFEKALSVSLMATQEISQSLELLRDKIIFNIAKDYMDHYTGVEILNEIKWLKRMNTHIDKVITYYEKALHAGIKENQK
jgi:phosphate:Na+ symporter